jgi:hypothetical protein
MSSPDADKGCSQTPSYWVPESRCQWAHGHQGGDICSHPVAGSPLAGIGLHGQSPAANKAVHLAALNKTEVLLVEDSDTTLGGI